MQDESSMKGEMKTAKELKKEDVASNWSRRGQLGILPVRLIFLVAATSLG
ncbi:hypothetical protein GTO91_15795 [Heliobacterium undosum]|uniref:Uncharacterized protein n=1 Tax=Heliomicrobium undosum TaxID=121734 RepID=A0A845L966_9FIRM|nr:hypothetical protein [Heliomicrobium undosum]MZP31170.1 hypothetical protein [Heliomicrobium undosum]